MKHYTAALVASGVIAFAGSAADVPPNALFGTWRGTSVCTQVRPACHDEIAVYRIAATSKPRIVA
jgi:hypothetical protein